MTTPLREKLVSRRWRDCLAANLTGWSSGGRFAPNPANCRDSAPNLSPLPNHGRELPRGGDPDDADICRRRTGAGPASAACWARSTGTAPRSSCPSSPPPCPLPLSTRQCLSYLPRDRGPRRNWIAQAGHGLAAIRGDGNAPGVARVSGRTRSAAAVLEAGSHIPAAAHLGPLDVVLFVASAGHDP